MKKIAFVAAALVIALSLPAAPSAHCALDTPASKQASPADAQNSDTNSVQQSDLDGLKLLAARICLQLQASRTTGHSNTGTRIENYILSHLEISRKTEGFRSLVSGFWNENAQHLICDDKAQGYRSPILFMKRVVEMEMQKTVLYGFLLSDEEDYAVTVNHAEIYDGKPETILDFLDGILRDKARHVDYDIDEIQELRQVLFEGYGAKNARDLGGSEATGSQQ